MSSLINDTVISLAVRLFIPTPVDPILKESDFETFIGVSFKNAPLFNDPQNNSSWQGSYITPNFVSSSWTQARTTHHEGISVKKFVVPSIGSITHV